MPLFTPRIDEFYRTTVTRVAEPNEGRVTVCGPHPDWKPVASMAGWGPPFLFLRPHALLLYWWSPSPFVYVRYARELLNIPFANLCIVILTMIHSGKQRSGIPFLWYNLGPIYCVWRRLHRGTALRKFHSVLLYLCSFVFLFRNRLWLRFFQWWRQSWRPTSRRAITEISTRSLFWSMNFVMKMFNFGEFLLLFDDIIISLAFSHYFAIDGILC